MDDYRWQILDGLGLGVAEKSALHRLLPPPPNPGDVFSRRLQHRKSAIAPLRAGLRRQTSLEGRGAFLLETFNTVAELKLFSALAHGEAGLYGVLGRHIRQLPKGRAARLELRTTVMAAGFQNRIPDIETSLAAFKFLSRPEAARAVEDLPWRTPLPVAIKQFARQEKGFVSTGPTPMQLWFKSMFSALGKPTPSNIDELIGLVPEAGPLGGTTTLRTWIEKRLRSWDGDEFALRSWLKHGREMTPGVFAVYCELTQDAVFEPTFAEISEGCQELHGSTQARHLSLMVPRARQIPASIRGNYLKELAVGGPGPVTRFLGQKTVNPSSPTLDTNAAILLSQRANTVASRADAIVRAISDGAYAELFGEGGTVWKLVDETICRDGPPPIDH